MVPLWQNDRRAVSQLARGSSSAGSPQPRRAYCRRGEHGLPRRGLGHAVCAPSPAAGAGGRVPLWRGPGHPRRRPRAGCFRYRGTTARRGAAGFPRRKRGPGPRRERGPLAGRGRPRRRPRAGCFRYRGTTARRGAAKFPRRGPGPCGGGAELQRGEGSNHRAAGPAWSVRRGRRSRWPAASPCASGGRASAARSVALTGWFRQRGTTAHPPARGRVAGRVPARAGPGPPPLSRARSGPAAGTRPCAPSPAASARR